MSIAITIFIVLSVLCMGAGAVLTLYRMAKGPSSLDRSIAADIIIAILISATGLFAVVTKQTTAMPVLVVLSLLGFTAAVAMARLISNRSAQVRELPPDAVATAGRPDIVNADHTGILPVIRIHEEREDEGTGVAPLRESWDDETGDDVDE